MKFAAVVLTATVLGQAVLGAVTPISVVDSTGSKLQITATDMDGIYAEAHTGSSEHQGERIARTLGVNTTARSGCMNSQWTCGPCSGINDELLTLINEKRCFKPVSTDTYVCDGQRVSLALVTAVEAGTCVETCSHRPKPLHCSKRESKGENLCSRAEAITLNTAEIRSMPAQRDREAQTAQGIGRPSTDVTWS